MAIIQFSIAERIPLRYVSLVRLRPELSTIVHLEKDLGTTQCLFARCFGQGGRPILPETLTTINHPSFVVSTESYQLPLGLIRFFSHVQFDGTLREGSWSSLGTWDLLR
jgi:hypothetical protein